MTETPALIPLIILTVTITVIRILLLLYYENGESVKQ